MIIAAILSNSFALDVVIGVAAGSGVDRDAVIALLGHAGSSGWLSVLRLAMLISVLSLILLAVGLVLRRATGLWIPVLLAVAAVERSVLAETGIAVSQRMFAVLDMLLFAIPAAGLAARMVRMSDEEWGDESTGRPPGRSRRRTRTTELPQDARSRGCALQRIGVAAVNRPVWGYGNGRRRETMVLAWATDGLGVTAWTAHLCLWRLWAVAQRPN